MATMHDESDETCMFFVDDSNIWIEAQKFAASGNEYMPKLEDSDIDLRLRIDIGRLVSTLCKSRTQGLSFLYGSRPPPNDSVWNAFKNRFKFKTKIYNRNSQNKEKEVDNSLATDLVYEATKLHVGARYDPKVQQRKERTVFIVITGDRDILPPVRKVLDSDIRVELWGWKNGIAKEYYNEQNDRQGLLTIHHLDKEFNNIFFTNFRSTRKGNKAQPVDPARTMVLCGLDEPAAEELDEDSIAKELLQLRRLFYISPAKSTAEILVEFPNVVQIEDMIFKSRELFDGMLTVISWPEYAQRFNRKAPEVVERKNMYKPLTDGPSQPAANDTKQVDSKPVQRQPEPPRSTGPPQRHAQSTNVPVANDAPDKSDGWHTVSRSDPARDHRRAIRQTQQCPDRIRCRKRGECGFQHTREERDLFRDNPEQNFALWKTKRCNAPYCQRGKRCWFAHTQAEGWCLSCKHGGHCTDECSYG